MAHMGRGGRALVVGGTGMLGRAVVEHWRSQDQPVLGLSSAQADIRDVRALRYWVESFRPEVIINCAAYTDVDGCEEREEHALEVNGTAVAHVVAAAKVVDASVVHLSSDYVFAGDGAVPYPVDDPLQPLSSYGRSKLRGEQEALRADRSMVVRTSWLFGPGGANFAATMVRLMTSRAPQPLRVVDDQIGAPTYTPFLAAALYSLIGRGTTGIVHYQNRDVVSWFDFACEIAAQLVRSRGLSPPTVEPVTTAEFPRPAVRPSYSVLDVSSYERQVERPVELWADGLTSYLEYLHSSGEDR